MFKNWLSLFVALHNQLPEAAGLQCPNCGAPSIAYQYVGDPQSRIGYLAIWCNKCLTGTQLSRVGAPTCVELLPFDSSPELVTAKIPNFRKVAPDKAR